MMHPVAFPSDGQSAERIQAALAAVTSDETRTEDILRERTTIPDDVLFQRRVTNVYVTADQALKFGLIHEIADFTLPPGNKIFNI